MTALATLMSMTKTTRWEAEAPEPPVIASASVAVFEQLADLLLQTSDAEYVQSPVGVVTSSLGGHYRHNLDHLESLLASIETGVLNYDHRERGTSVENSRLAALQSIRRLQREVLKLTEDDLSQPLRLTAMVDAHAPPMHLETTVARELAFVLSHTIHHNAIIGVMAKTLGINLPARFGYAPSTIAHQEKRPCVR